ncbi:hypothetical protein EVAR_18163_1 [Eumeta japonica]|uniref:Uncharacterized protein n=1 Tax=Eumeta variegata TaxID=151549 RepID=A0A4C1UX66_EUMVA|nr:hypothetical protein EVAR_18163_1 [Eumeta japonica]
MQSMAAREQRPHPAAEYCAGYALTPRFSRDGPRSYAITLGEKLRSGNGQPMTETRNKKSSETEIEKVNFDYFFVYLITSGGVGSWPALPAPRAVDTLCATDKKVSRQTGGNETAERRSRRRALSRHVLLSSCRIAIARANSARLGRLSNAAIDAGAGAGAGAGALSRVCSSLRF